MALQATLKLEGKSYDVRDLDYEIYKPSDNNNKPSASYRCGIINFTILSPMDQNLVFHEWVKSIADVKEGKFYLPLTHGVKHVEKTLAFKKAHCVRLHESYSSYDSSQMYMRITISASIIICSDRLEFLNKELPG